jgi:hypothetical protein
MTHSRKSLFLVCGVVFLAMTAASTNTAVCGQLAIAPAVQSLPIMGEPSASLSQQVFLWLDRLVGTFRAKRADRAATTPRDRSVGLRTSSQLESRADLNPEPHPPLCSGGDEATGPWPVD